MHQGVSIETNWIHSQSVSLWQFVLSEPFAGLEILLTKFHLLTWKCIEGPNGKFPLKEVTIWADYLK